MSQYYSRRQLYSLGEPLGDSATQTKVGGGRIYGGGGGGGGGGHNTGPQGGGGGGGGGGYGGGVGGNQYGENDGAYSGSNGGSLVPSGCVETDSGLGASADGKVIISYVSPSRLFSGGDISFDGYTWTHTYTTDTPASESIFTTKGAPSGFGPFVEVAQGWTKINGEWKQFFPSTGKITFNPDGTLDLTTSQGVLSGVLPADAAKLAQGVNNTNAGQLDYASSVRASNQLFYLSQVTPYPITANNVIAPNAFSSGAVVVIDKNGNPVDIADSSDPIGTFLNYVFDPTLDGGNEAQQNSFISCIQAAEYVQAVNNSLSGTTNTYTFTVPPGIFQVTIDAVAGGGGGGGGEEVGVGDAGGGGGGAGYVQGQTMTVSPGEQLTITIGQGGGGAPVVGRTTGAPGGAPGSSTAITGLDGHIVVTGGRGGGGGASADTGGGGGGKIICTKLYELGLLPKDIYEADQAFGARLVESYPDIYNGYRAWAEIVVDWMNGQGPKMMPWMSDDEFSTAAQQWSTRWAQAIATPWANWMAHKNDRTGLALMIVGTPISYAVGVWRRIFGPARKPAGFVKGLALIAVFVLLRAIVLIGKGK